MQRPPRDRERPEGDRRGHRHLRHHRLAAQERAGQQRPGRHARHLVRRAGSPSMALLDPHPALKAVSPQASPADMFLGDDFHHNGAFRLSYGFEYAAMMETEQGRTPASSSTATTPIDWYLRLGPLSNVNEKYFHGQDPDLERLRRRIRTTTRSGSGRRSRRYLDRVEGADAERRRLVGPGGFLRPAQDLRDCSRSTTPKHLNLPGRRARGTTAAGRAATATSWAPIEFGSGHRQVLPRQRSRRPGSPTGSRTRASATSPEALIFQTGANAWADVRSLAAESGAARKQLYFQRGRQAGLRDAARRRDDPASTPTSPTRRIPCRTGRGPITPTYPGAGVADVAGRGPALRRQPPRRAELGDRAAGART